MEFKQLFPVSRYTGNFAISCCTVCGLVGAFAAGAATKPPVNYEAEACDYLIPTDNEIEDRMRITRRRHRRYLDIVKKYLPDARQILDFDAGAGYFVKFCREEGYEAQGVELSENLVRFAEDRLGITLMNGLPHAREVFDVVAMFDVIEHFDWQSSRAILGDLVDQLKPNGLFLGNTPNFNSLNILISGKDDPVISPPYHTTYFTPTTLTKYLESFGLKKISIGTIIFSEERFFRKFSLYDTGKESAFSRVSKRILRLAFKILFRPLFWILPCFDRGYQIHYCFQKPT